MADSGKHERVLLEEVRFFERQTLANCDDFRLGSTKYMVHTERHLSYCVDCDCLCLPEKGKTISSYLAEVSSLDKLTDRKDRR